MQGPVGFRCKNCGTLANDPLRAISPAQGLFGLAIAFGLGVVASVIAGRVGFFSIFISFIAGGFIAEAVTRVIGWKRGPAILVIILGGIIAGHAGGFGLDYLLTWGPIANVAPDEGGVALPASFFLESLMWAVISAGAACVGAYSRLR